MASFSMQPIYLVFAGVNGAGKSTFYRSGFWKEDGVPHNMPRINPDEIIREYKGDWRSPRDQRKAGANAISLVNGLFEQQQSFNQETTLAGHLALRNIVRAHDLGYRVILYYIGVQSVDIALKRIENRVLAGGHDIEEHDVRRRFSSSLSNFALALEHCSQATVLDNTRTFTSLAQWENGVLSWWGNPKANGPWLLEAMQDETVWQRTPR